MTPAQQRARIIADKRARTADERVADSQRNRDRKLGEKTAVQRVTWLDRPVPLSPRSRTMVVGVCSDASPETRRAYGV